MYKALELKASFTELTVKQKALFRKMNGEEEEEEESSGESVSAPESGTASIPEGSGSPDADTENSAAEEGQYSAAGEESSGSAGEEPGSSSAEGAEQKEEAAEKAEPAEKEEMIPALNREPEVAEIPWEYEDYTFTRGRKWSMIKPIKPKEKK